MDASHPLYSSEYSSEGVRSFTTEPIVRRGSRIGRLSGPLLLGESGSRYLLP